MKLSKLLTGALVSLLVSAAAHAGPINLFDVNTLGDGTFVAGNTPDADYKFDVDGSIETPAVNPFTTVVDGNYAKVYWSPLGSINIDAIMLKVSNAYILWNTSAVNWSLYDGFEVVNNLIKNRNGKAQDISHVSINFDAQIPPQVPDGGTTAALLGLGLVTVGFVARRQRR